MNQSTLTCLIKSNDSSSDLISEKLKLTPYLVQNSGDAVITPKGNLVGSSYSFTTWGYKVGFSNSEELENKLKFLISRLSNCKDFLSDIFDSGGKISVYLSIDAEYDFEYTCPPKLLLEISNLNIHYGIRIF